MSFAPSHEEFKAAQKSSWNNAAQAWRNWWATFEDGGAQELSDRLVELAEIKSGHNVLDIATGIGEPAVTAAKRVGPNGKVAAIDISLEMLAIAIERAKARRLDRIITFEVSDAEIYAYPVSSFHAVISRWGLMFLPNLVPTLRKIRESLVPDGIFAAAVWSAPEKAPVLMLAQKTAAEMVGLPAPTSGARGSFRLADIASLEDFFRQAGFTDIKSEKLIINFKFRSAEEFISFHRAINVPVSIMLKNQQIWKQEEVWEAIRRSATQFADDNGALSMNNEIICITGRR